MGLSIWQILLVVVLLVLLFGRGKIPGLMKDVAEGIKGFKAGMADADEEHKQEKIETSKAETIDVKASEKSEEKAKSTKSKKS